MKKMILFIFGALVWSIAIQSCESSNAPESGVNVGTLQLKITDAPFPFDKVEEANVTISKIEVRNKEESEDDAFEVVFEEEVELNLLNLRNGVTENLPGALLGVGSYDLVRLYVSGASIKMFDSELYDLTVPSGAQTGIKLFVNPEIQIQGGLTAELLLDFDLSESFVIQGNIDSPNGFLFKPVIRAVNNSLAGSINGTVTDGIDALMGVEITVTLEGESATAVTGENGYYQIIGLKEGDYSVSAELEGYVNSEPSGVSVVANEVSEQNFVLSEQ